MNNCPNCKGERTVVHHGLGAETSEGKFVNIATERCVVCGKMYAFDKEYNLVELKTEEKQPTPLRAAIGEVGVFALFLDGGSFARCDSCQHPHRVHGHNSIHACIVCGNPLNKNWIKTNVETYRASRANDAPIPYTAEDSLTTR